MHYSLVILFIRSTPNKVPFTEVEITFQCLQSGATCWRRCTLSEGTMPSAIFRVDTESPNAHFHSWEQSNHWVCSKIVKPAVKKLVPGSIFHVQRGQFRPMMQETNYPVQLVNTENTSGGLNGFEKCTDTNPSLAILKLKISSNRKRLLSLAYPIWQQNSINAKLRTISGIYVSHFMWLNWGFRAETALWQDLAAIFQ